MFCGNCGNQILSQVNFCPVCGEAVQSNMEHANAGCYTNMDTNYPYRNKWIAFFLCLFLGCIGAHRFYVGKIGTGILWLLTGGLFAIGALIDLIIILTGGFRDEAGYPLIP